MNKNSNMHDILPPKLKAAPPREIGRPARPAPAKPKTSAWRAFFVISGALILTSALALGFKFNELKKELVGKSRGLYEKTHVGASALASLDTETAKNAFGELAEDAKNLKSRADGLGFGAILRLGEKIMPGLRAVSSAMSDALALSMTLASLANKTDWLSDQAFSLVMNEKGPMLLRKLDEARLDLKRASELEQRLKSSASAWGIAYPSLNLAISGKLYQAETLLKSAVDYLSSPETRHIAILFQNPSEIRPAGGFIGSYADITVEFGSIKKIDVRDIYDPDGQLDAKILPPRALQAVTGRWGARDANWFFDFPTSAKKVLSFLNKSKIYSEQRVVFTSALALNVRVIEDILGAVGPIELPEYKLTLDASNFLENVQKEVEEGIDKKNGEPKRILRVLTPRLLERLVNLKPTEKRALAEVFKNRIKTKDILAFVDDRALEGYLQSIGLGGEIFSPERIGSDDYLAVVHANIAGGKTDAFMKETVALSSFLDTRGIILNKLIVEREHTGKNRKEWWYRSPNKDFFQILTLPGARLLSAAGHDRKIPDDPLRRPTYEEDADVLAIEKSRKWLPEFQLETFEQFAKNTFANWLTIRAGEQKKIELEYENPRQIVVAPGTNYRFVFERQSGVKTALQYQVEAPPGYIWKESGKTTFSYESDNPDGRIILDLTLEKLL